MQTSTIYKDRTNGFSLVLKKNGVALNAANMSAITKYELRYKNAYYNSEDYPDSFDVDIDTATVTIRPEPFELSVSNRRGDTVEFIIYDAVYNIEGLVWDQFKLIVKKDAALLT